VRTRLDRPRAVRSNGPVRRTAWRSGCGLLALCAVALTACGGQDVVVQKAPTARERGVAPQAGGTVERDPLRNVSLRTRRLTITVDDSAPGRFRYRAPRSVRGGLLEIRLRNIGDAPHKAQLWRITGQHTVKQALAGMKAVLRGDRPLPDWLLWGGGVSLTAPGATSTTLQVLPAGRYFVAATMDDPGSVAAFAVGASNDRAQAPRAPARIEMRDYAFRVTGLKAGRNSVDVDNTGAEPHFAYFARMRPGADLDDVRTFLGQRVSTGRPPVDTERTRETAVLEGGQREVAQVDLPAGRYALLCYVRNREGGPRHLELGMINEVTVGAGG
jgi:hypothetical protein